METNLTKKYANGNNPMILGRDTEIEMLFLTLLRNEKPNAVLIGEPGVGKTSIIHQAAYLISNQLCPKELYNFQIIEINTNALLAGPGYRGVTEQKFEDVINSSIKKGKVILFMDEFHTVEHLGEMANGQTPGLGNTLKPYLTRPDFRVVGATTSAEYSSIKDKALLRRFFKINVLEPIDEAVISIIRSCLKQYGKGIIIKNGVIQKILELSKSLDGFNPDKAKDLTDFICSYAKFHSIETITVTELQNFFDKYYMMKKQEQPELVKEVQIEEE